MKSLKSRLAAASLALMLAGVSMTGTSVQTAQAEWPRFPPSCYATTSGVWASYRCHDLRVNEWVHKAWIECIYFGGFFPRRYYAKYWRSGSGKWKNVVACHNRFQVPIRSGVTIDYIGTWNGSGSW